MSQFLKCCVPWLRQKSFDAIWLDKGAEGKELWRSLPKMRGEKKIASHRLFWLTPAFFSKSQTTNVPCQKLQKKKKKLVNSPLFPYPNEQGIFFSFASQKGSFLPLPRALFLPLFTPPFCFAYLSSFQTYNPSFTTEPMKDDEERSIIFEGETPHEGLQGQWVADPEPERRCCVRYGLIIINATLVAAAAVLITVGMIAKRSSISRLCPQCRDVSEAAAVIGIIFLITSTLGFFALLKRHVGVLVTYVVVTSLLMFGIVGITLAGIILAASGVNLSHEWKEHVTENSDLICSVQSMHFFMVGGVCAVIPKVRCLGEGCCISSQSF